MPDFAVPIPAKVLAFLAANPLDPAAPQAVISRGKDLLTRKGYVLGPGGIRLGPSNGGIATDTIYLDIDRDPSADIAAFDPAAKSAAEQDDDALTARLEQGIARRQAGTAFTPAQQQEFDVATLKALVYLRKNGLLGGL